ncbi:MAG: biopolymer transporter ExbD [Phycisphaerae bacterium]|nr:biopolymer transporter ExbD [Phycisphaerae bacterium]MCZ2401253.1 biopolymer transporter ExbD [Phycisphaerae bacterium]
MLTRGLLRDEHRPMAAMEMTPLIDMVFLLLIFFLAATTFHQEEREMKIALPIAKSAGPISSVLRELVINVDAEGRVILGGRGVSHDDLRQIVRQAVDVNPAQKVVVRADRHVAYGAVVTVLDICKSAGIQEPYLDTLIE